MFIRKMSIADYEEVYRLWINTPGMGLNDLDDSKAGIELYLNRNPNTCFIAEDDNKIIGVIMSGHDGRRGFIHHTAVVLNKRGQGVGSALVEASMAALRKEGINKVALVVFSKNTLGNEFWESKGFKMREDLNYRNKVLVEIKRIDI